MKEFKSSLKTIQVGKNGITVITPVFLFSESKFFNFNNTTISLGGSIFWSKKVTLRSPNGFDEFYLDTKDANELLRIATEGL